MLAKDVWKDLKGYEGEYLVSYYGEVYSLVTSGCKRGICTINATDTSGYPTVHLYDGVHRVHILVASTFLTKAKETHVVNHLDGNKSNCCVDNLEYCSSSQNTKHAIAHGLMPIGSKRKTLN